jgi:tRNA modification GTPase
VVLWFPGPASATGEDVAEFHVHGGRAVLSSLFAALSGFEDVRAAEPGEFTRRAFENGKLDLTEAEGLDDLIHADTDRQRRQALRQLKGLLGDRVRDWRAQIIEASALIEAGIDFSDEGDVPAELIAPALAKIKALLGEIEEVLAAQGRSERLRDGLVVAIAGPPNVGKSTLMNQLARREVAIVSPFPGTTRDVLEVHLDLGGYPVTVLDTAGIRDSDDPVEREGVRRASEQAAGADLVLWLVDAAAIESQAKLSVEQAAQAPSGSAFWFVVNKIDLIPVQDTSRVESRFDRELTVHLLSSQTGAGVEKLVNALGRFAEDFFTPEPALVTRERQRAHLKETGLALQGAQQAAKDGREEIMAEQLRLATRALGKLLGRVDVEDILDVIFRDFCIGK